MDLNNFFYNVYREAGQKHCIINIEEDKELKASHGHRRKGTGTFKSKHQFYANGKQDSLDFEWEENYIDGKYMHQKQISFKFLVEGTKGYYLKIVIDYKNPDNKSFFPIQFENTINILKTGNIWLEDFIALVYKYSSFSQKAEIESSFFKKLMSNSEKDISNEFMLGNSEKKLARIIIEYQNHIFFEEDENQDGKIIVGGIASGKHPQASNLSHNKAYAYYEDERIPIDLPEILFDYAKKCFNEYSDSQDIIRHENEDIYEWQVSFLPENKDCVFMYDLGNRSFVELNTEDNTTKNVSLSSKSYLDLCRKDPEFIQASGE